jgi:RNA polymerase sigma factor (sigma-70 family)
MNPTKTLQDLGEINKKLRQMIDGLGHAADGNDAASKDALTEARKQKEDELFRETEVELRKLARHWIRAILPGRATPSGVNSLVRDAFLYVSRVEKIADNDVVWQSRHQFYKFVGKKMYWLVLDELKKWRRDPTHPDGAVSMDPNVLAQCVEAKDSAAQARNLREKLEAVRRVMESDFSEDERTAFEQKFFLECSTDEIAETMDRSPATVNRLLRSAKETLNCALDEF